MVKRRNLYIVSLGFVAVSIVFIALLVFTRVSTRSEDYVLATRIFSKGISALFFYLAYSFTLITLVLSIFSIVKENHYLRRISFFFKLFFIIFLITPFFTSIYYEYSHESDFFVYNLLAIDFLIISLILDGFAIKNLEDNTPSNLLINNYCIIINLDYFLLLISGSIIIISSFIYGDFSEFDSRILDNTPIFFLPIMSLVFYIYNSFRLSYLKSRYFFSFLEVIESRFIYYFISYLVVVRLGYFAYSTDSFYGGLKILRLIIFLLFISIVIFNSFLPKIDLSFVLAAITATLFTFEMIGLVELIKSNSDYIYLIFSYLLDYIIVIFIAIPYYIFNGIRHVFLRQSDSL